jgi:nitrous oxidase accessory protein NosD
MSPNRLAGMTLVLLAVSAGARAEVTGCTEISSVPFTVASPGIYCLNSSIVAPPLSGSAIEVSADDVVIDLNGHTLEVAGPNNALGVRTINNKNVTVRNGTIRGFAGAVSLGGSSSTSQGHVVEKLRVEGSSSWGIRVQGPGVIVRNNLVIRSGGSKGGTSGIIAIGSGAHVVDNEVVETVEDTGSQSIAINVGGAPGAVIERNVISNGAFGPTDSYGIFVSPTCPRAAIIGNRVANMRKGIFLFASGIYHDNTVGGATTPFGGANAPGATNFSF